MTLKELMPEEFEEVFANEEEFGDELTFEIKENGFPKVIKCKCVWDNDTLKQRAIVSQQGVFLGTVLLFISKRHFVVRPRPEEVLIRLYPRSNYRESWVILDVTDAEGGYEIYLDKISA